MELEQLKLLQSDLVELNLSLEQGVDKSLLALLDKVLVANESMNLTAITDKSEAIHKHLIDSLSVLLLKHLNSQISQSPVWTDVGSGAGFPGLVLALAVPSAQIHLIESTTKKSHFLNTVTVEMGIHKRVHVHNQRAETLALLKSVPRETKGRGSESYPIVSRGTDTQLRNASDAVFFRGVSRLASLVELGAPLIKLGGLIIAYKGPKASDELSEAEKSMKELKFALVERKDFSLPGTHEARSILCLQKLGETSKKYPRAPGLAQKEPII